MTTYTLAEARDTIIAHFENEWVNVLGLALSDIYYQNRRNDSPENGEVKWCRFSLFNTAFNKSSLTNIDGVCQYDREAILLIELLVPLDDGIDDVTSQGVLDIFEGGVPSMNGIWFREVTVKEIGASENWYRTDIIARVLYNQVK